MDSTGQQKLNQLGIKKKVKEEKWLGLAHTSLSGLSYLPLRPSAHHISSLMNKPIKRARSISLSLLSLAPLEDIRVYHLLGWAAVSELQISFYIKDPFR